MLAWVLLAFVVPQLSAPSLVTPEFREYFKSGMAMRVTLPTGKGGVVHLFVGGGC